jgi:hypothetical protein
MNPPPFDENKKAVRDFPNHFEKQERFITSEDPLGIYAKSFIFEAHPKRLIPPTSIDLNYVGLLSKIENSNPLMNQSEAYKNSAGDISK